MSLDHEMKLLPFRYGYNKQGIILFWGIISEFLLMLVVFLILIFARGSTLIWDILITFLSLATLGVFIYIFYNEYKKIPVVDEKNKIIQRISSVQHRIKSLKDELSRLDNNYTRHEHERRNKINLIRKLLKEQQKALEDQRKQININEEEEIGIVLQKIQQTYITAEMQKEFIENAEIAGMDPELIQNLRAWRIVSAADVNITRLAAMPIIDPTIVKALEAWRKATLRLVEIRMPKGIPAATLNQIRKKYKNQRSKVVIQIASATMQFDAEVEKINQDYVDNGSKLIEERKKVSRHKLLLESELVVELASLREYDAVTFRNFIGECWLAAVLHLKLKPFSLISNFTNVLISLLVVQAVGIFGSTVRMVVTVSSTDTPAASLTSSVPGTNPLTPTAVFAFTNMPTISVIPQNTAMLVQTKTSSFVLPNTAQKCIPVNAERQLAKVVKVIDGDTINVDINGEVFEVKYAGINAPEYSANQWEYYGLEALKQNQNLVENKIVTLVNGVSESDADRKLIRYVLVEDVFVNYELLLSGFAFKENDPVHAACATEFTLAQSNAMASQSGLWKLTQTTEITVESTPIKSSTVAAKSAACDPSYPNLCIAPPPPILTCDDIAYRFFKVVPPDSHGFDENHDGIGCAD